MLLDAALRYSLACALSYLPVDQLNAGKSEYQRRLSPTFRFREQVSVDEYCASATIFEDATDSNGPLLVAFRGSTAPRNYQSMFKLGLVENRLGVGGKVHDGYQARASPLRATRCRPPHSQKGLAHASRTGGITSPLRAAGTRPRSSIGS